MGWYLTWQDPVAIVLSLAIVAGLWRWRRRRHKRISVDELRMSRRDREN